ncbi:MAG: thioredoxin family protein, partial [Acidobacteriota bacterium]|nr:thioredoxin family protein [Acidobacteriota bacterium]
CRKLDKQVLANVDVSKHIREQFVFARVEYESEEGEAFMKRYNVQGFPNLLVLDADGNLVKKLAVTFNPGQFLKSLDL